MRQCAVIGPAVVFEPCGMVCILVQIFWANAVVLAFDHVTKAAKEAFDHVGMLAVVAVNFRVVYTLNMVAHVQFIPIACLIGVMPESW